MKEEKISVYRVLPILGIMTSAIVLSGILCVLNKLEMDEILCILFVIFGFMPVIGFALEYERRRGRLGNNTQTNYKRIETGFFICCILMLVTSFLPEFYRPVILIALILVAFSNVTVGMTITMFLNVLLAMTTGGSFHELLAYTMLALVGVCFANALEQATYRLLISIVFMFVSVLFPSVFYYLANKEMVLINFLYCIFNGIITAIYAIKFYPIEKLVTDEDVEHYYIHLLEDDFIQVREVRAYSQAEYRHALKVSKLAFEYARKLGLNAELSAAAGFYYRLGRWEGEPVIENAIKKAQKLCFPIDLIQILQEYNGERELPSTPESALIHIIDTIVIKAELLEKEVGKSQWNREVIIYQTLNELSTAGLYDKSGLSINAFIKIREWLAKEELLV